MVKIWKAILSVFHWKGDQKTLDDRARPAGRLDEKINVMNQDIYDKCDASKDDDGLSINSFSTNATMDDNPGPGRLIDKYIYQLLGRKIERFASRMSIYSLHPAQILRRLNPRPTPWRKYLEGSRSDILREVSELHGSYVVAGLESLVKQSQSKNVSRCTAALVGLVCVSLSDIDGSCSNFNMLCEKLALEEPVSHLKMLAESLDDSQSDKSPITIIIDIAQSCLTLYNIPRDISPEAGLEFSHNMREKLIELLRTCRSHDIVQFSAAHKACRLLADVYVYMHAWRGNARNLAFMQNMTEMAYFLTVFLIRSICHLRHQANCQPKGMSPIEQLLLLTLVYWSEFLAKLVILFLSNVSSENVEAVRLAGLLRSPFYVLRRAGYATTFPLCYDEEDDPVLCPGALPAKEYDIFRHYGTSPALKSFMKMWAARSRRLLAFPGELEKEVWASTPARPCFAYQLGLKDTGNKGRGVNEDQLLLSLRRAWKVRIHRNNPSWDFLSPDNPDYSRCTLGWWKQYMMERQTRHACGELFRCNYDWDWDPSSCLKRLFKLPEPSKNNTELLETTRAAAIEMIDNPAGRRGNIVVISPFVEGANLPKKLRVLYKSKKGETKYKSYWICSEDEDAASS